MVRSDRNLRRVVDPDPRALRLDALDEEPDGYLQSWSGQERNHLFLSHDGGSSFSDASGVSGLDDDYDGRTSVLFDFDRDGWLDIAAVNANRPLLQLYRNQIGEQRPDAGRFLAVALRGGNERPEADGRFAPRDGYGAKLRVAVGDSVLVREHRCGEGFAGQNSATMIVGLGNATKVDRLEVEWPAGAVYSTRGLEPGTLVTAYERPERSPTGEPFVVEAYLRPAAARAAPVSGAEPEVTRLELPASETQSAARLRLYTTMATWCASCRDDVPQLWTLRTAFSDEELALFGVPVDPEEGDAELAAYVAEISPPYELLQGIGRRCVDELLEAGREALGGDGVPMSFVLDEGGELRLIRWGAPTLSEIRRLLRD